VGFGVRWTMEWSLKAGVTWIKGMWKTLADILGGHQPFGRWLRTVETYPYPITPTLYVLPAIVEGLLSLTEVCE